MLANKVNAIVEVHTYTRGREASHICLEEEDFCIARAAFIRGRDKIEIELGVRISQKDFQRVRFVGTQVNENVSPSMTIICHDCVCVAGSSYWLFS